MSALYEAISAAITSKSTVAFIAETDLEPVAGSGSPIAPPTYAGEVKGVPTFAVSEDCPIPTPDRDGWHATTGEAARGTRVIVNSVQAESGRAETALWDTQGELGLDLPGLVLTPPPDAFIDSVIKSKKMGEQSADVLRREASNVSASSWTLAHRQVDAWLKFAMDPATGKQVWEGGPVKELIVRSGPSPADDLFRYFPNSAFYGFWLSAGVARRIQHARSYASEIIGYDAAPVLSGATKLDPMGGASKDSKLSIKASGQLAGVSTGKPPSEFGFGQVPTEPEVHAFSCRQVVQHSSLSLRMLGRLRFTEDPDRMKWRAAATALTLLSILGRAVANEDTFLRSGCSLVATGERWGWRTAGTTDIETIDVASIDDIALATRCAVDAAGELGLVFAPRIEVTVSEPQLEVMADAIVQAISKQADSGD